MDFKKGTTFFGSGIRSSFIKRAANSLVSHSDIWSKPSMAALGINPERTARFQEHGRLPKASQPLESAYGSLYSRFDRVWYITFFGHAFSWAPLRSNSCARQLRGFCFPGSSL
jgi:hypothetical protein